MYPIALRHGMTAGELAKYFNKECGIGAGLTVVPMKGWHRDMYADGTPLQWVMPSPNMPTLDTAIVYPGAALIEGTNISEGRGTTRPFELIGAPFIDGDLLAEKLNALGLPGVRFRSASFTPTTSKWVSKLANGIQIHVTTAMLTSLLKPALQWSKRSMTCIPANSLSGQKTKTAFLILTS